MSVPQIIFFLINLAFRTFEELFIEAFRNPDRQIFVDPTGNSLIVGEPGVGQSLHFSGTGLGWDGSAFSGTFERLEIVNELTFLTIIEQTTGADLFLDQVFLAMQDVTAPDPVADIHFVEFVETLSPQLPELQGSAGPDMANLTAGQVLATPGPGPARAGNLKGGDDTLRFFFQPDAAGGAGTLRANGGGGNDRFLLFTRNPDGTGTDSFDAEIRVNDKGIHVATIDDIDASGTAPLTAAGATTSTTGAAALAPATTITARLKNFESFVLAGGDDRFIGGGTGETVDLGDGADVARMNGGADSVDAGSGDDRIFGGAGQDTVGAGGGADFVDGGDGRDVLDGQGGSDRIRGSQGGDTVRGGSGSDTLIGEDGSDRVFGGPGDDTARGGPGDDTVNPGRGDAIIWLGRGADVLVFDTATDQGADRVMDANPAEDVFRILGGSLGDLSFALDGAGNTHVTGTNVDFVLVGVHSTDPADFTWHFA